MAKKRPGKRKGTKRVGITGTLPGRTRQRLGKKSTSIKRLSEKRWNAIRTNLLQEALTKMASHEAVESVDRKMKQKYRIVIK